MYGKTPDDIKLDEDFENYLLSAYSLEKNDLDRLLSDLSGALSESVEDYIEKRHLTLQRDGLRNARIYEILQEEIRTKRFPAPELSIRQIRRIIYG